MTKFTISRRSLLKTSAVAGAGIAAPMVWSRPAYAYTNEPTGGTVTLGFNVPQTGAYAEEGADELRAYELAVEHLNGGGDGGMLATFSSCSGPSWLPWGWYLLLPAHSKYLQLSSIVGNVLILH